MHLVNMKAKEWGKFNLVHNTKEKYLKPNGKMEWPNKEKAKFTHPQVCTWLEVHAMWIKSDVKNDVGEAMVM